MIKGDITLSQEDFFALIKSIRALVQIARIGQRVRDRDIIHPQLIKSLNKNSAYEIAQAETEIVNAYKARVPHE